MTRGLTNQSPAGCSIKDNMSRADRQIRAQQFVQINFQETNICDTINNDFQIVSFKLSTQMSSGSQSYYLRQALHCGRGSGIRMVLINTQDFLPGNSSEVAG